MILDSNGKPRPARGTELYWSRHDSLMGNTDLHAPLSAELAAAIDERVTHGDSVLDSAQIGAQALTGLPTNWYARFNRTFSSMPTGALASIVGMEIYRQMATRLDVWEVLTKLDPYGAGWNSTMYARAATVPPNP